MARLAKLVGISDKTAYKYVHIFQGAGSEDAIQRNPEVTKKSWQTIGMTIAPMKDTYFGMSVLGVLRAKASTLTEDDLKQIGELVRDARKHCKSELMLLKPTATIDKESNVSTIDVQVDLDDLPDAQRRLAAYSAVDQEQDRLWNDCNRILGRAIFHTAANKSEVDKLFDEAKAVRPSPKYGAILPNAKDSRSIMRERSRQRHKLPSRPSGNQDNRLVHGDCLKLIPRLEDDSIDVILTDPPYSDEGWTPWSDKSEVIHDAEKTLLKQIEVIAKAVGLALPKLRERACIFMFFPLDYVDMLLCRLRSVIPPSKNVVWQVLVWDKQTTPKTGGTRYFSHQAEAIVCCNLGDRPLNAVGGRTLHGNILGYPKVPADKAYSAWKPIELLKRLIELTTDRGDMVLDCFAGAGSTGVACNDLERRFILFEKNESQFAIAKSNLPDAKPGLT